MLAKIFRCVMRTPLGSPVAPDVNTISTTSSRSMGTRGVSHSRSVHSKLFRRQVRSWGSPAIGSTSSPTSRTRASIIL